MKKSTHLSRRHGWCVDVFYIVNKHTCCELMFHCHLESIVGKARLPDLKSGSKRLNCTFCYNVIKNRNIGKYREI